MKLLRKIVLWTLAGVVAVGALLAALVFGPSFIQALYLPKIRYEIPAGYRGWVQVEVGNQHCPSSVHLGRFRIYRVDAKGHGCTSDLAPEGWRIVKYNYVLPDGARQELPTTGWGNGGMIWGENYGVLPTRTAFFVGTEQQFHNFDGGLAFGSGLPECRLRGNEVGAHFC